jgi:hypothetical protein
VNTSNSDANQYSWRWDKADPHEYYRLTFLFLSQIDLEIKYADTNMYSSFSALIELTYERISSALLQAACITVPRKKQNFFKSWWDAELSEYKKRSLESFRIWQRHGKPKNGPLFDLQCKHKLEYKLLIKTKEAESASEFSDELTDALLSKNNTQFWRSWNKKFPHRTRSAVIEDATDQHSNDFCTTLLKHIQTPLRNQRLYLQKRLS